MRYKEMDPELVWKAIENYDNILGPQAKGLEAFYRQFACKGCGSRSLSKEIDKNHVFSDPDTLVPRSLLRCQLCRCLFDPHTGIILESGDKEQQPSDIQRIPRK